MVNSAVLRDLTLTGSSSKTRSVTSLLEEVIYKLRSADLHVQRSDDQYYTLRLQRVLTYTVFRHEYGNAE